MTDEKEKKEAEYKEKIPIDYYNFYKQQYADCEEFEIRLYRVKRKPNNRSQKTFLKRYYDEIPVEEDIAAEFGSGQFQCQSMDPVTGDFHGRDLHIDEIFDKIKEAKTVVNTGMPPGMANPMEYMEGIIKGVITPIMTLVNQRGNGRPEKSKNDDSLDMVNKLMSSVMNSFTTGLNKMQTTMIDQQIANVKKITGGKDSPGDPQAEMVNGVLSVIKELGTVFINSRGKVQDAMRNSIMNNPNVQDLMENPDDLDMVYSAGCNDAEIGKDKMDKLFQGLKIETPEETVEQVEENDKPDIPAS